MESTNRKHKYSEDFDHDVDNDQIQQPKRRYVEVDDDRMIYSIGNEVHFTAHIDDETIETVIKQLSHTIDKATKKFCSDGEKVIITYIVDSPGGSVTSVLKFVDFIRMAKMKHPELEFVSVITGLVASAGTIMCIIADKKKMTHHAYTMIHELSGGFGVGRKYTHIISHANFVTKLHETLVSIYLDKVGDKKSKDEIERMLKDESWFTAEEYQMHGFVDEIL